MRFIWPLNKNRETLNRKKIYLVRHGQTDFNLKGVVQGSGIDAPLNATGQATGKGIFRYLSIGFRLNRFITLD